MARPPIDPAIKAGNDAADEFGLTLTQMGELLAVIDSAAKTSSAITPAALKNFGLNPGDVRDIESRLKRGSVLATIRAGLTAAQANHEEEQAALRASSAARNVAPRELGRAGTRAAAKNINPRRIVMRKAPDVAWRTDNKPDAAPELWQQDLNLIAQAHGFGGYKAVQGKRQTAEMKEARWDMCAHLSAVHKWGASRIAHDFAGGDESNVRHGLGAQGGFALQVAAMENLLGEPFVPVAARALPAESLVMYRYQKLLPDFEDMEDAMRDVAMPQGADDMYADVDGKRVLSPQGRKLAVVTIRAALARSR